MAHAIVHALGLENFHAIDQENSLEAISEKTCMLFAVLRATQEIINQYQMPNEVRDLLSQEKNSYLARAFTVIDNLMLDEISQPVIVTVCSSLAISDTLRYAARYLELKPREMRERPDFAVLINHHHPQVVAARRSALAAMEALAYPMRCASELMCDSIIGDVVQRCLHHQQAPQIFVEGAHGFIFMASELTSHSLLDKGKTNEWHLCQYSLSFCSTIMQLALKLLRPLNTLHEQHGIGEKSLYADGTRDILLQGHERATQACTALSADGGFYDALMLPEAEDIWVPFPG